MRTAFFTFVLSCPVGVWFSPRMGRPPARTRLFPAYLNWLKSIHTIWRETDVYEIYELGFRRIRNNNQLIGGMGELLALNIMRDWLQPPPLIDYEGNAVHFRMLEDNDPVDMVFMMYTEEAEPVFVHVCVKTSTRAYSQPASRAFMHAQDVLFRLPHKTMVIRIQFKYVVPGIGFWTDQSYCRMMVYRNW